MKIYDFDKSLQLEMFELIMIEHFYENTDIYVHGDSWHIDKYYECDCWDVFQCN